MKDKKQVCIERESRWNLHEFSCFMWGFSSRGFVCIFTYAYEYLKTSAFSVDKLKLVLVTLWIM